MPVPGSSGWRSACMAGPVRTALACSDSKRSATALTPETTRRATWSPPDSRSLPTTLASASNGQRCIWARRNGFMTSPNASSRANQAAPSPRWTLSIEEAVSIAERPRAIAWLPGNGWAAGTWACTNRTP